MCQIKIKRPLCFISFLFACIVWISLSLTGGVDLREYGQSFSNKSVSGVIKNKSNKNDREILYVNNYIVYLNNQLTDSFKIGQKVSIKGTYSNFELPDNEGQFNMRQYYRIKGYEASLTKAEVIKASKSYWKVRNALFEIKNKSKKVFEEYLSENESGIMEALVLGDKEHLSEDVKELYQDAGISHILSLSGLHIASVGIAIFSGMLRCGLGSKLSGLLSSTIMLLYAILTGMSTSTLRALIMFLLGVLAKSLGRTYDLLTAVSFSMMLILIENPYYVYDSGFLLSISAVFGIGLIYPIISHIFVFKGKLKDVYEALCISASATLSTLPVTMCSFYRIPVYGVLVNLLVVPLAACLLFSGICIGIVGNFMTLHPQMGLHKICCFLSLICSIILKIYERAANISSGFKGSSWISGRAGSFQIVLFLIIMLVFIIIGNTDLNVFCPANKKESSPETKKKLNRLNLAKKVVLLILLFMGIAAIGYRKQNDLNIRVISVGQGACNVISGKKCPVIMIDGGSTDQEDVWKYRISPCLLYNGIGVIDYCFITHPDKDHVSGIIEMLEENRDVIKINKIIMSTHDTEIDCLAENKGIDVIIMGQGDEIKSDNIWVKCLYPDKETVKSDETETNEQSLVLLVKSINGGFTAMFTGDIGIEDEKKVLCYVNESPRLHSLTAKSIDFLSVAHHGSKNSSDQDFLNYVGADIYTISAGKGNSYGHPHKETLKRLEKAGGYIFRTDISGQITVSANAKDTRISTFHSVK